MYIHRGGHYIHSHRPTRAHTYTDKYEQRSLVCERSDRILYVTELEKERDHLLEQQKEYNTTKQELQSELDRLKQEMAEMKKAKDKVQQVTVNNLIIIFSYLVFDDYCYNYYFSYLCLRNL